jgi:serine/threonine-protein kinase
MTSRDKFDGAPPSRPSPAGPPSPDAPKLPLSSGQVVGGKYTVERLLGQGGMGAVFVARQDRLARRVAIKVLLPAAGASPEVVARFDREARSAAALQSDHVTRVLDVGHLENGAPYLVMELLEGQDLADALASQGRLDVDEAIAIVLEACDAIAEAHSLGIVHRDLKPSNLFLARRPNGTVTVKVLDFGVSKAPPGAANVGLTSTSEMMGSPLYMSPEQLTAARHVDGRTDIWSLGITLYELIAGSPPFVAHTVAELGALVLTTEPAPLRTRREGVSDGLDALVLRCLRKQPADRFPTVADLAAALRGLRVPAGTLRLPPTPAAARTPDSDESPTLVSPALALPSEPPRATRTPVPVSNTRPPEASPRLLSLAFLSTLTSPSGGDGPASWAARVRERTGAKGLVVAAILGCVAGAGAIAALAFRTGGPGPHGATTTLASTAGLVSPPALSEPAAQASLAPPAVPALAAQAVVRLRVDSDPDGASVREDGVELCSATPCDIFYKGPEADPSHDHSIVFARPGYRSETVTFRGGKGPAQVKLSKVVEAARPLSAQPAPKTSAPSNLPAGYRTEIPY